MLEVVVRGRLVGRRRQCVATQRLAARVEDAPPVDGERADRRGLRGERELADRPWRSAAVRDLRREDPEVRPPGWVAHRPGQAVAGGPEPARGPPGNVCGVSV